MMTLPPAMKLQGPGGQATGAASQNSTIASTGPRLLLAQETGECGGVGVGRDITGQLTHEIGRHKRQLIELARQAMSTITTAEPGGVSDRSGRAGAVRRPRRLETVRREQLITLHGKVSHGHDDPAAKTDALRDVEPVVRPMRMRWAS